MLKKFHSPGYIWPATALLVTAILSLCFYISLLFYVSNTNERSSKIYKQSLISSIHQYEYLPALVATDTSVKTLLLDNTINSQDISERLKFIAKRSGADAIYLMDREGTVKAASNYDTAQSFLHQNYAFRPYFQQALQERKRQFYYAQGATTGIPGFFIASPILESNKVLGVAVVKIEMSNWEQHWNTAQEDVLVTDKNGVVILSAQQDWRYRTIKPLAVETLAKITEQQQFKDLATTPLPTKSVDINFTGNSVNAFWVIDGKLYLVNHFAIDDTGWNLYYLVKHDNILHSSIVFFVILSLLMGMAYLTLRERHYKIQSQHKHRDLEIRRRKELQAVMDNIHIGVIVFDHTGRLLSVNEHAKHLLLQGKDLVDDHSTYVDQLIEIDISKHGVDALLLENIASPAYHETSTSTNNAHTIPIMFAISALETMDQSVYLMTVVNIQRRKTVENELIKINQYLEETINSRTQELRDAQAALMQKNKAVALGNMAATIVHEISQPLAAMNSSIAAANAKIEREDWVGANASMNRLLPLNEKMHNIIKLLKSFSYQDEEAIELVNIYQLINQSLECFRDSFAENNITLAVDCPNTMLYTKANPIKLDLVISNIVKNAIDATEQCLSPKIGIIIEEKDHQVQITVRDNGKGVEPGILKQLFNPYFTTKQVGKGLGLGLSITYEIVQQYHGTIQVANGRTGADFIIHLPLEEPVLDALDNHG